MRGRLAGSAAGNEKLQVQNGAPAGLAPLTSEPGNVMWRIKQLASADAIMHGMCHTGAERGRAAGGAAGGGEAAGAERRSSRASASEDRAGRCGRPFRQGASACKGTAHTFCEDPLPLPELLRS